MCTSVEFLPWRSCEVITGGIDSKLAFWNFTKGRPYELVDFGNDSSGNAGQCHNPPHIHSIAVPEIDMLDKIGKICAVPAGGVVNVIDIDSEIAAIRSKSSSNSRKGSQSRSKDGSSTSNTDADQNGKKRLRLDFTLGGHTGPISSVAFSMFGERGKFIISGGNDKLVKVWNWSSYFHAGLSDNNDDILHLNIDVSQKVSWLCTTPADTDNLVVCDTSKTVKIMLSDRKRPKSTGVLV
ncbi:WD40-repeat-containing domain [Sesbania bispinosa]|nr:WD40-repeat-containing domain [Sesbania bispinosa]